MIQGELHLGSQVVPLERLSGIYNRLTDYSYLPELAEEAPDSPLRRHCEQLHAGLRVCVELAGGRVVNDSGTVVVVAHGQGRAE